MITFKEYDDRTDQFVADEIKRRKKARITVNATDDYRMKKSKPAFTMPSYWYFNNSCVFEKDVWTN